MKKGRMEGEVLVVDDDPRFLEFVTSVASRLHLSVTTVRFGEEALRLLAKKEFRLLILDGLLPGMRGEDVAKKARETFEKNDLPILFCSAFYRDLRSFRHLMGECGISLILHKPLDEATLADGIRKLIDLPTDDEGQEDEAEESEERAALKASYLGGSLERVSAMRRALQALGGPESSVYLSALQMEAHRFRGSGASFDLPEVTRVGGAMEDLLRSLEPTHREIAPSLLARLEGLIGALEACLRQAAGNAPILPGRLPGVRPRVLLLDGGKSDLAKQITSGEADGLPIWHCENGEQAIKRVLEHQVEVAFIAADGEDGGKEALSICRTLLDVSQTAVILLSRDDTVSKRHEALKAGAKGYVPRPADVDGLFRIAAVYTGIPSPGPVLLVGEESVALSEMAEKLADLGRSAVPCDDKDRLFEILEESSPSLVIFDGDPSWEDTLALVQVLRGDLCHRGIPILVATEDLERSRQVAALAAGATATLAKPFTLLELQPLLSSWVIQGWEREKTLHGLDVQTGLIDERRFEMAFERGLGLAKREGRILSVLGIDVGLYRIREEGRILAAEEHCASLANQLRTSLRSSDMVARVGKDRFLALLPGAEEKDAERILTERIEAFRESLAEDRDLATPMGALRTFPAFRGTANRFLVELNEVLDSKIDGERWENDLVVEVDEL